MSDNLVYAYNAVSGEVGQVPARYLDHPVLGKNLREVRTGKPIINAPKIQDIEPEVIEPEVIVESEASAEADVVVKTSSKKTDKEKE